MSTPNKEQWEIEFDEKFAKISHLNRGEFVITDSTGSSFQAHTENGKVTEIGGLESVKDFIRSTRNQAQREILEEVMKHRKYRQYDIEGSVDSIVTIDDIHSLMVAKGLVEVKEE